MDVTREPPRGRRLRRQLHAGIAAAVGVGLWLALAGRPPAPYAVERDGVWIGEVRRGEFVRQVRGHGRLVPESVHWISAASEGRVARVLEQPGSTVAADTVLVELLNPELEAALEEARWELEKADAARRAAAIRLESELLDQELVIDGAQADENTTALELQAEESLAQQGLTSQVRLRIARARTAQAAFRLATERKRLALKSRAVEAELTAVRATCEQLRAAHTRRRRRVRSLRVRAGVAGVLQQLDVELGQRVTPEMLLAKVADPTRLRAELRVEQTQATHVALGQRVTVDTRNGVVAGRVARIDPVVQGGSVAVEVVLLGRLPSGVRPDLSVDGTIEIEREQDVLFVDRPVLAGENQRTALFRLSTDRSYARRVPVRLGRSSVSVIEVLDGLQAGDRVVLSDSSAWAEHERIRIQ